MKEKKEHLKSPETHISRQLDQAAWVIGEDRVLQFIPDGVRLFNFIETGETQLVGGAIGDVMERYTNVAVKEPLADKDYPSLEAFLRANGKRGRTKKDEDDGNRSEYKEGKREHKNVGRPIKTPEFLAWKENLPSEEDIITAVHRLAALPPEERPVEGEYSEEAVSWSCLCTLGGVVLVDTVEGDRVSLRKLGEPNPDCSECDGTGKTSHTRVHDPRANARPREIKLINELSGDSIDLVMDLPRLVVSGEMDLDIGLGTSRFAGLSRSGKYLIEQAGYRARFEMNRYIAKQAKKIGINMAADFVVRQGGVVGPEWEFQDWSVDLGWYWQNHNGEISSRGPEDYENIETLVQRAQSGLREHRKVIFRPAGSEDMIFAEIKTELEKRNCTLGLGLGFVATEECGPTFYILDQAGNILCQLTAGYKADAELYTALQKVRQLPEQILTEEN